MSTSSGLVIDGAFELIPGLDVKNFHDEPRFRLRMGNDGARRSSKTVCGIVLHSTKGIPGGDDNRPQRLLPGLGPVGGSAEANIRYWTSSDKSGGAHILVDYDGSIICTADLVREMSYHATSVNAVTIGIEIVQGDTHKAAQDGTAPNGYAYFYDKQLDALVKLLDYLTRRFRIQRQIHSPYHGSSHPVPRLVAGGKDCYGVYQHRDQTSNRGAGDAGEFVLQRILTAGYEPVDFSSGTDLSIWKTRQQAMNLQGAKLAVDGIPGAGTARAIEQFKGRKGGMWVQRPGD